MTHIMLAKAYTTCVHKQRRVEQQLAIDLLKYGGQTEQQHNPHNCDNAIKVGGVPLLGETQKVNSQLLLNAPLPVHTSCVGLG